VAGLRAHVGEDDPAVGCARDLGAVVARADEVALLSASKLAQCALNGRPRGAVDHLVHAQRLALRDRRGRGSPVMPRMASVLRIAR
jgi:hypothetical protein